jgi:NhaA family Na+:H+ antiporter
VAVLKSGVHATLAGIVLAMFIPFRAPGGTSVASAGPESPPRGLEDALHPWVIFTVLPVFAFANAGVSIGSLSITDTFHSVRLGIATGLFFGKQLGIMAMCWIAVRLGIAALPEGMGWRQVHGMILLCGIGFTMSLFIASLAFDEQGITYQGLDRMGILIGSFVSGFIGYVVFRMIYGPNAEKGKSGGSDPINRQE